MVKRNVAATTVAVASAGGGSGEEGYASESIDVASIANASLIQTAYERLHRYPTRLNRDCIATPQLGVHSLGPFVGRCCQTLFGGLSVQSESFAL